MFREKIPIGEIERLYSEERWPVTKIAKQLSITTQAVYSRMRKAGLPLDPARRKHSPELMIRRAKLRRLFEVEKLSIQQVADLLDTTRRRVKEAMKAHGIAGRARGTRPKKYPQVAKLKIGHSFDVALWRPELPTFTNIRRDAKQLGIRIVIRRLDESTARVTRTPLLTPENVGSMYRSGMSEYAIAAVFQAASKTISKILREIGDSRSKG